MAQHRIRLKCANSASQNFCVRVKGDGGSKLFPPSSKGQKLFQRANPIVCTRNEFHFPKKTHTHSDWRRRRCWLVGRNCFRIVNAAKEAAASSSLKLKAKGSNLGICKQQLGSIVLNFRRGRKKQKFTPSWRENFGDAGQTGGELWRKFDAFKDQVEFRDWFEESGKVLARWHEGTWLDAGNWRMESCWDSLMIETKFK